jgi:hypothetical protein
MIEAAMHRSIGGAIVTRARAVVLSWLGRLRVTTGQIEETYVKAAPAHLMGK